MLNKLKSVLLIGCMTGIIVACDTDTNMLGDSLTNNMDHLQVTTGTFNLATSSIEADAVLARNSISYIGTVKDPETGEYITANYMTQFHTLENFTFPEKNLMKSVDKAGEVVADSCELRLFYDNFYGDSLAAMKLAVYEMDKPMSEANTYYSDFDPKASGLTRVDGLKANCSYTLADLSVSEADRQESDYTKNIRIALNSPYTDKNGKEYNNYGSYIINKYYEDPTYFKNSIRLTNHVLPGMYVESTGGLGSMAYISLSQLNIYFRYGKADKDTTMVGSASFSGTEEVMQYTRYVNDKVKLQSLAGETECTYLKSPSGIFTQIDIPVEKIFDGHDNDTINSAKFTMQCMNNKVESDYSFASPKTLLLIPRDSLTSFFEHKNTVNYKTSYLATFDTTKRTYTFNNISSLVKTMQLSKQNGNTSATWNSVVLVPVTTSTDNNGNVTKVVHDMSLTSTRLVKGREDSDAVTIDVIYSKYK